MTLYPVIFAGAGPGDPELITVKAQQALLSADFVLYAGSLVPEAVLRWARPGAEIRNSAGLHLDEIVGLMATAHREGKRVVRLHTGDPSLYGAIFEQMTRLSARGIPYRVIPGVTAAFAAAAALGIEYTLPEISQTLILTRMEGRTPVPPAESLASLAAHQASMAIYLSITLVEEVARTLSAAYGAEAPCAVVYRASQPEEKVLTGRIADLVEMVRGNGITHQALILVGKVLTFGRDSAAPSSKLYDPAFSHGYREGVPDNVNGKDVQ